MNQERRKALEELALRVASVIEDVEALRDEEQEYFDNMPEAFQSSAKGEVAEYAIESMESALQSLEEASNYLNEAFTG